MIEVRTTWGPVQWDGSLGDLQQVLLRLHRGGAPLSAKLTIGPVSQPGAQVSARTEEQLPE